MKVAFVGSSCCGKTTTLWEVGSRLKKLEKVDFELLQEVARECPYPINETSTFETQNWIVTEQIRKEAESHRNFKNVICDRSVWDSVVFFDALRELQPYSIEQKIQREYLYSIAEAWSKLRPYDAIFLFTPLAYKVDAQRSKHPEFQKLVANQFENFFVTKPVIRVDQSNRQTRAEFVYTKILELMYP